MKQLRLVLWVLIALLVGAGTYAWLSNSHVQQQAAEKLGGPFNLVNHNGEPVTETILAGRNYALFFGFTNCPDICPTTLLDASVWLKELGEGSDEIDFYFVTIDPEHDTAELLKDYVSTFDPRITGLTGSSEQISNVVSSYRIYAKRVALDDGDYTMDHTASVMLFDENGKFRGTIAYDEARKTAVAKLRRIIEG